MKQNSTRSIELKSILAAAGMVLVAVFFIFLAKSAITSNRLDEFYRKQALCINYGNHVITVEFGMVVCTDPNGTFIEVLYAPEDVPS